MSPRDAVGEAESFGRGENCIECRDSSVLLPSCDGPTDALTKRGMRTGGDKR